MDTQNWHWDVARDDCAWRSRGAGAVRKMVIMTRRIFKELPPRNAELDRLLEKARNAPPMTPEEREEQRRSFAYGNAAIENPGVTRELVDRVADGMTGDPSRLAYDELPSNHLGHAHGLIKRGIWPMNTGEK